MKKLWLAVTLVVIGCGQASGGGEVQTSEAQAPIVDTSNNPFVSAMLARRAAARPSVQLPDNRTLAQVQQAACTGRDGKWKCPNIPQPPPVMAAIAGTPSIPASWTVPAWFIDPTNSSTHASDSNNCTTSSTPCLTWHQINDQRWGCIGNANECPRLRQNTTITWMSSQSDNTDPVYYRPSSENQSYVIMQGTLGSGQQVATGVLGTVTAKNRSTPQLLTAVLPAGTYAAGELIQNATHSSEARLYALVSGTTWKISQPLVPVVITNPYFNSPFTPVEVNNWTAGDTVTIYSPVNVNIVDFSPVWADYNQTGFNNQPSLYALNVFDPGGADNDYISEYGMPGILYADVGFQRVLNARLSGVNLPNFASNCDFDALTEIVGGTNQTLSTFSVYGGQFRAAFNATTTLLATDQTFLFHLMIVLMLKRR
jgi:hypothetical protein